MVKNLEIQTKPENSSIRVYLKKTGVFNGPRFAWARSAYLAENPAKEENFSVCEGGLDNFLFLLYSVFSSIWLVFYTGLI